MQSTASTLEQLSLALDEAGIATSGRQRELLARHLDLVIERNRVVNLTRITSVREATYLHVVDSLLLGDAFASAPEGPFVDMGTGAGYPGIPLAIVTGRQAVLIDSVGKKVAAVQDFVNELGLSDTVRAVTGRVEDFARKNRGDFAVVTARAVAQTNVLVEYAAPLLMRGGRLVVAKARPTAEEVAAGDRAARICGLRRVSRETLLLPHDMGQREILVYERTGNPSVRLPRPVGTAKHHPLG
ncbi:MAG: 16S rRNA (guanine(527)-N(7))-methyltransferase RsmG [Coriobacteriales bacterium]|nr:16S rRNA (guanine(527)-N(7))-methyltransferase RsmG [Coriobacteriales bacterium]